MRPSTSTRCHTYRGAGSYHSDPPATACENDGAQGRAASSGCTNAEPARAPDVRGWMAMIRPAASTLIIMFAIITHLAACAPPPCETCPAQPPEVEVTVCVDSAFTATERGAITEPKAYERSVRG